MGRSNRYYLIARDRKNNNFDVVKFDGKLESIDLYTTQFKDNKELGDKLFTEGRIRSNDVDLYIAIPKKDEIITNEVLYSDGRDIRSVAKDSLNGELEFENSNADELLSEFCNRMANINTFYDMVVYGKSNIYPKFVDYFAGRRFLSSYDVKYKNNGWSYTSYNLLRNIVEAFDRYLHNRDYSNDIVYRKKIEDKLMEAIFGTNPAQANLFDFLEFKQDNINSDDKLIEVMNVFEKVSSEDFKMEGRSRVRFLGKEEYGEDLHKLRTLLGEKLTTTVGLYAAHRNTYDELTTTDSNFCFYADLIKDDRMSIVDMLSKDDELLDKAYEWTLIYSKYISKGDEYGYQRRKKDNGVG